MCKPMVIVSHETRGSFFVLLRPHDPEGLLHGWGLAHASKYFTRGCSPSVGTKGSIASCWASSYLTINRCLASLAALLIKGETTECNALVTSSSELYDARGPEGLSAPAPEEGIPVPPSPPPSSSSSSSCSASSSSAAHSPRPPFLSGG